jgi:hypothetical protein
LLVTGAFGAGKTSVIEEIADIFERRATPFAALDLDWLAWFVAGSGDADDGEIPMLLRNLGAIVANYLAADVRYFLLAKSVGSASELASIRAQVGMPLTVVGLTVPITTIEARLGPVPTTGRADDLSRARAWLTEGTGAGLEDVALEILSRLGWS